MSMNICTFSGRLGIDPKITKFSSGKTKVEFSIAVDRDYKDKETNERQTDWISVIMWNKEAFVNKTNLAKGDKVQISGRFETFEWTDENGKKHYGYAINVDKIYIAQKHRSTQDAQQAQATQGQGNQLDNTHNMADDEDLPF